MRGTETIAGTLNGYLDSRNASVKNQTETVVANIVDASMYNGLALVEQPTEQKSESDLFFYLTYDWHDTLIQYADEIMESTHEDVEALHQLIFPYPNVFLATEPRSTKISLPDQVGGFIDSLATPGRAIAIWEINRQSSPL
jgi:hypothetical protein